MFSLHVINSNKLLYFYNYIIFNNILNVVVVVSFFSLLFLGLAFSNIKYFSVFYTKQLDKLKFIYLLLLVLIFFLYSVKFISNFWLLNNYYYLGNIFCTSFIIKKKLIALNYMVSNYSLFSDTIVLLCIITTFISWVYLSERNLFLVNFNIFYFFIFIIFTINMVYTTNLLSMFIFFEFIFLPSLYFVYWLGYSKKVDKTIKYLLIWTLTGSFLVACGLVYLYSVAKTLSLVNLYWFQFSTYETILLYLSFFLGFGVKLPLWPFHYWLTKVHVEAPTGFSIFLSGYLVKTAFFCLIYFCILFKTTLLIYISLSIIFFGSIDASIRMWTATDIKRLIAFATIQEMNLIVGLFFLLNNLYLLYVNLFLLVHGVLSALLFFLVDQVQKRFHTRNLVALSGLAYKLPMLHTIIWLSILIFRGFPIFIKFFIEWELLSILMVNCGIIGFIIFFLVSLFGVLGFCRIWFSILYGQPSTLIEKSVDLLKKDLILGGMLVCLLFILTFLIIFF